MKSQKGFTEIVVLAAIIVAVLILLLWGWPKYRVYSATLHGQAVLAEAESSRQVAVREALALKDSATYKSQAEVIRARGVAQANEIIGDSLKGHDEYLRYLYIDMMHNTQNQFVYVPTEAGLPIMEANRFNRAAEKPE